MCGLEDVLIVKEIVKDEELVIVLINEIGKILSIFVDFFYLGNYLINKFFVSWDCLIEVLKKFYFESCLFLCVMIWFLYFLFVIDLMKG